MNINNDEREGDNTGLGGEGDRDDVDGGGKRVCNMTNGVVANTDVDVRSKVNEVLAILIPLTCDCNPGTFLKDFGNDVWLGAAKNSAEGLSYQESNNTVLQIRCNSLC